MSSTFGNRIHLSIFGQSHSTAIGCSLDGLPAGIPIDLEALQAFAIAVRQAKTIPRPPAAKRMSSMY